MNLGVILSENVDKLSLSTTKKQKQNIIFLTKKKHLCVRFI